MTDPCARGAGPTAAAISVVLPAWNAQATVGRTIVSVFAQTARPGELIVVDDGSTDATADAVAALARAAPMPVRLIRQPNGGAGSARNRGVAEARGAWVALIDADDEYLPEAIERLAALADAAPGAAVAFGDALRVERGVESNASYIRPRLIRAGEDFDAGPPPRLLDPERLLLFGSFLAHGAFIARRDLLLAAGPCNPHLRRAIDRDMFLRLAVASDDPWVFTWERLARITYVEGSLSSRGNALRHALAQLEVLADHGRRIEGAGPARRALLRAAQRKSGGRALYHASLAGPGAVLAAARALPGTAWPALLPDLLTGLARGAVMAARRAGAPG
jgi:glycosyltransferase involved in cell wall biosynthesis